MPTTQLNNSLLKFLPPKLSEGKEWYISYYVIYPYTGKLRRIRIKINRIKGIGARRQFARRLINEITIKLVQGWNPFVEKEAPKAFYELYAVIDTYLNIQAKEAEEHSLRSYKSYIKHLKHYLERHNQGKIYVSQFDRTLASNLMLEIKQNPKYSPVTYNNYLAYYTLLFNWMIEFNYISQNPFASIKKTPKKFIVKKRRILTNEERAKLRDFLIQNNYNNYLVMCLMCYYCFLRPNEISQLKIKDIDIENQLIYVSADIAKNDHSSTRTMPNAMMEYVRKLDTNYPEDYYLFGLDKSKRFTPQKKRAEGREIARFWNNIVRTNLKWPMELQFYSLKDTGITNMLADGVAPNFVQGQADHSSLKMTSIYAAKRTAIAEEQIKNVTHDF